MTDDVDDVVLLVATQMRDELMRCGHAVVTMTPAHTTRMLSWEILVGGFDVVLTVRGWRLESSVLVTARIGGVLKHYKLIGDVKEKARSLVHDLDPSLRKYREIRRKR